MALPPAAVLDAVREALARSGASAALDGLADFLSRLDADYFERESAEDIALHAGLAAGLAPGRRARLAVTAREAGCSDGAGGASATSPDRPTPAGRRPPPAPPLRPGHATPRRPPSG